MYHSIKYKECFYIVHQKLANIKFAVYSIAMLVVSLVSILIWSISKQSPVLWSVVIAIAQFAQAIGSYLPWKRQTLALSFLLPRLNDLTLAIDKNWMKLDLEDYDDKKIQLLISKYESEFLHLQNEFTQDLQFSEGWLVKKMTDERHRAYFYSRYPVIKELERSL